MTQPLPLMPPAELNELVDLVRMLREDTADENAVDSWVTRIEEIVCNHQDGHTRYLQAVNLMAGLHWCFGRQEGVMGEELAPVQRTAPILGFLGGVRNVVARPIVWSILAVAVVFYGTFVLYSWNLHPDKLPSETDGHELAVATVNDAANVQWFTDAKADGAPIKQGEPLKIEAGLVELRLTSGVTFVVEGPAKWTIEGANRGRLESGKIVAKVPTQAIGFTLDTPSTRIIDLGTEFGVSVDERGVTEAQVFRGAVEIETLVKESKPALQGRQKRRLAAGEAARVDVNAKVPRIQTAVARPEQFVRQLSSIPKKQDHEPSAYAKYVIKQTQPVLYWNFDNPFRDILKDLVRAQSADNFTPKAINQPGPRPTDGFALMSAGNRAASVTGSGDVSYHELSKKLKVPTNAYSAQIWFNSSVPFADRTVHHFLCRGNSSQSNGVRDSLFVGGNYDQTIKAGYLGYFDGDLAHKDKLIVGKTLLSHDKWYLATFVRDGDRVRVYLNGDLEIDTQSPWYGGDGDYLTFGHRTNLQSDLGLKGRFDEVAIWDRALSADEVSRLFQYSKDALSNQSSNHD